MGQADDDRPAVLFRALAPPRTIARLDYEGALWELTGTSPDTPPRGLSIRQDRQGPVRAHESQPVVILTGAGTAEAEQQVRALGVTEFVEKGISLHHLGEALKRLLNQTAMTTP